MYKITKQKINTLKKAGNGTNAINRRLGKGYTMKFFGFFNDCRTIWGDSYKVTIDNKRYHVCPEGSSYVFVGLIEWEKELKGGIQIRYIKGIEFHFKKSTAQDTVWKIIAIMGIHPDEFEELFNKVAKPSNKNGNYPKLPIKKILEIEPS